MDPPEEPPEEPPEDPPEDSEWAMQLAVHAEKSDPPAHSAVCAAAASAVARVLTEPDERWQEAVRRWETGPVRKVTRRARGVRWTAVQRLPGVTASWAGAEVRAFVPGPVTRVPPELARLQVAGLDLSDDPGAHADVLGAGPPRSPYAAIALNPDVRMSTGKAAAQCGHAAHLLVRLVAEPDRAAWIAAGAPVRIVHIVDPGRADAWSRAVAGAAVAVRDAGFTEVPAGTMTAVARLVRAAPRRSE